jgi:hypothetical protein
MAILIGGVEELRGLADLVNEANATSEFFSDFTGDRVLGSFPR